MKLRLFIAINLPEKLKNKLNKLILELEKRNREMPIKWVNSQSLHLTLHFLGYIEKEKIPKIKEILQRLVKNCQSFKMQVQGIDGFPNLRTPRVIFLDCPETRTHIAQALQKAIGDELKYAGFEVELRPWREHITLGRVKSKCHPKLPKVEITAGEFKVNAVELMASKLSPTGAKYSIVKSFELG